MPLKTVLETLDGLDETVQSLYTQTDAGYVLDVEGVDAHPEVANLKSAYERTKADRKAAMEERDALKDRLSGIPEDFDPDQWKQLKSGQAKADPEELVKLRQTLEAERDEWKQKFEGEVSRNRQIAVERTLDSALAEQGVTNPTYVKAARVLLSSQVQTDAEGNPVVETDMGPVPLADHVKRWVAGEGKAFVTPPSGGGSRGNDGSGTASAGKKAKEMSEAEKGRFIRENGLDAWKEKLARERGA